MSLARALDMNRQTYLVDWGQRIRVYSLDGGQVGRDSDRAAGSAATLRRRALAFKGGTDGAVRKWSKRVDGGQNRNDAARNSGCDANHTAVDRTLGASRPHPSKLYEWR